MEKPQQLSEGAKLLIHPKAFGISDTAEKNQLFMLGLQLLSKSLKPPCAVVQPQPRGSTTSSLSTAAVIPRDNTPPSSPLKVNYFSGNEGNMTGSPDNRKRKRVDNNQFSETDKRDKR